mmetsp:Transcript_1335/g.3169  ORF Transcript_1335/g.3169 Transcript_1335/m.3169 type:complete len:635 (+) Transcript_1335:142-2046(+)
MKSTSLLLSSVLALSSSKAASTIRGADQRELLSDKPHRIFTKRWTVQQPTERDVTNVVDEVQPKQLDKDLRIIGGQESTKGRFSYAVSLEDRVGHFCGGSLIGPDVVLTAAHCVGGGSSSFSVVVGRHDLNPGWSGWFSTSEGQSLATKDVIKHPDYSTTTTNNDFAIIVLSSATTEDVEFVNLNPSSSTPQSGDSVTVMGWGDTNPSDAVVASDKLRDVEVKVMANSDCEKSSGWVGGFYDSYAGDISAQMLCARDPNEDSCQGDSGGPLVIKGSHPEGRDDIQVGVVSWGVGCASSSFPGVYARVSSAYEWIRSTVCENSSAPPESFNCGEPGEESESTPDQSEDSQSASSTGEDSGVSSNADDEYCQQLNLELYTDAHATETSWKLEKIEDGSLFTIGSGPPRGFVYSDWTDYKSAASGCMPPGEYRFTVFDSYGDGIINGGFYRLSLDDKIIAEGNDFGAAQEHDFTISGVAGGDELSGGWVDLLAEDFRSGFGRFNAGGPTDVKHYVSVLGRSGVVRIENGNGDESSIVSNNIFLDGDISKIRVQFSFYANSMEWSDAFCLDYNVDGDSSWTEQLCWDRNDFSNDIWYDDVESLFDVPAGSDYLRIRFRCDASSELDDILFSSIDIQGM